MGYLNLSLFAKTARLGQILADIDTGSAPAITFYAGMPPGTPDDAPEGALLASLPCSSPFGAISNGIDTPTITAAGAGYASMPAFALVGSTEGSGSQFQVAMQLATFQVSTPGTDFAVNDLLVLPPLSATCLQSVVLMVTAVNGNGGITGASIQQAGQFISLPGAPVSQFETTGSGQGAVITFSTYSVAGVTTVNPGQNYTSAGESGTALFSGGGGAGAAAAVSLTPVLTASAISTVNAASGGTIGMARISDSAGLALQIAGPGTGGTNGTFELGVSGGAGSGFAGTFTVVGGQIVALQIQDPGVFTVAPTITTSASPGLSGASVTATRGAGVVDLDVGVAGSGASVIINSTNVVSGGPVVVTSAFIAEA